MTGLNKDIPVPLYHQLKDVIQRGIQAGHWKPDEQLPTENDLAARFGVSKITVRHALRELASLGYVRREQGRGTFVQRPPLEQGPHELVSFTEEMRRHGLVASSRVLDHTIVAAPADVAFRLHIRPHDPVFHLRRLRLADREPMGIQATWIPMTFVPGIEAITFGDVSLYEVLHSRFNLQPVDARETYVAVLVTAADAALLASSAGAPAVSAERLSRLADGTPLELTHSIMRGDRYKIVLDLTTARQRRRR